MKPTIITPRNPVLKKYVQFFLFFKKTDDSYFQYTTFPNNNLCLAVYKQNEILYRKDKLTNSCLIKQGKYNYTSRMYGFHKMPFQAEIQGELDQFCILFYPAALRVFTSESYDDLLDSDLAFQELFSFEGSKVILEEIFNENNLQIRAEKLEVFLLKKMKNEIPAKLSEALYLITAYRYDILTVETLAKKLGLSSSTVFRLFKKHLGQNPKTFLNTIRFRLVLDQILENKNTILNSDVFGQYHDQAHLIHDFKIFSGYAPKIFGTKVSVEQDNLTWICNE